MHTGRRFTPLEFFKWTARHTFWLLVLATIPTALYALGWDFLALPWQPLAIVGTAVAFIVGFKNNASYNRIWEARQIYGTIINNSRSFGYALRDAVSDEAVVQRMFYRHFAWLTALRYQLREPRTWENMGESSNVEFRNNRYEIPETTLPLADALQPYLADGERAYVRSKKNRATQLTALQSKDLALLKTSGLIDAFQWTILQQALTRLTDDQGRAERIKNFPYPRNFASITTYLLFIFVTLVPFGLLREMAHLGDGTLLEGYTVWFNIPFAAILTWAFHTLDAVGESSVNPFEGSANDVPITQISRTIEIDLRDMLDEPNLPQPITPVNSIVL